MGVGVGSAAPSPDFWGRVSCSCMSRRSGVVSVVSVGIGVSVGRGGGVSVGITTGVAVGTGVSVGGGTGVSVGSGVGVSAGRSVGVGSGVGVSVGGITTGVGTTTSPLSTSGSSRNSFFSSSSRKTGSFGSSSFLAVLFCSSFMTCLPNWFSSSQIPRKQSTSVSPRSLSCSTLIIVPQGDAVPAGVTMRKGRLSDSTPSSKMKIFPSSNSIIVSWFTPNCPKRQTVSGVVLIILRKSWTRMSTRASLSTKVLTPSPGTRSCPISAGKRPRPAPIPLWAYLSPPGW